MLTLFFVTATAARAGAIAGVDFVPFGRGDQAWIDAEQESGTLVAETDGLLHPPLTAWGGLAGKRIAGLLGLAVARITTSSVDASGGVTRDHVGALRPALDLRYYLEHREPNQPLPYLQGGVYGVIPSARHTSDSYTDSEQQSMDQVARDERARIGAMGVRAGAGAEVGLTDSLYLGARYLIQVHRGLQVDTNGGRKASTTVLGEAALTLAFAF